MKHLLSFIFISITLFNAAAQITVDFNVNKNESCGSLQAIFQDNSTSLNSNIVKWNWDLSGIKSDRENPGRIFDQPGTYTICLEVTDNLGNTETLCKDNFIVIHQKPSADFKVNLRKGCSPLQVNFDDLSTNQGANIINWIWDIGGSENLVSTSDKNKTISTVYDVQGLYSVSLSVEDENGCKDVVSKKDFIEIFSTPKVILSRELKSFCDFPWVIQLKNENIDPQASYFWDFGNGNTFVGPNPPLTYYFDKGSYDVTVVVQKAECIDTFKFENYINTDLAFEIKTDIISPCVGEIVKFSDKTELSLDSIKWNFGDGSSSIKKSPEKIFTSPGCYVIKVTRYFANCVISNDYPCITVKPLPTINYEVENQFTCTVPVDIIVNGLDNGVYNWSLNDVDLIDQPFDSISNKFALKHFGKYYLNIDYKGENGCSNSLKEVLIEIDPFSAELPRKGPSGCVPYFASLSDSIITNTSIVSYNWSIKDLNFTSSNKSPQVYITDTGRYDVQLIVENIYGCKDTILKNGYLQGGVQPEVDFSAFPLEDCLSKERNFTSINSKNVDFWIWDFGDTGTSLDKNPSYTYGQLGTFDVTLAVFHNGCGNSVTKKEYISILKPISSYEVTYNCDDPFTVDLNNLSVGADSIYWFIQNTNGAVDTIRDSILNSYTFPNTGRHILGVYTKNDSTGCEHIRSDTLNIVNLQPYYAVDTLMGCHPLTINVDHLSTDFINYNLSSTDSTIIVTDLVAKYTETGLFSLPILSVEDIHGCVKTYQDSSQIFVNGIRMAADFKEIICVPDTATLLNKSTTVFGNLNSIKWITKDTTLANEIAVIAIDSIGLYEMKLVVTNDWNCVDSIPIAFEGINSTPDFSSDTLGCIGKEILFVPSNQALTISDYFWDFGDGTTSNDVVPRHSYTTEGNYTVCLSISDIRGCTNMLCKDSYIQIAQPVAAFYGNPLTEECPPLLSLFTNNSTNAIRFQWDFGDNSGFSNVKDPSHIYTEPGKFDVSLIAIRSNECSDTLKYTDYVEVQGPSGSFSYDVIGNCAPLEVNFKASSDRYYKYLWDFGNGIIDSSETLMITDSFNINYNEPGKYAPKLIVTDESGCARTFSSDPINVNKLQADFELLITQFCDVPTEVVLINRTETSTEAVNFEWELDKNGIILNYYSKDLTTTLDKVGYFDVSLIALSENCTDTIIKDDYIYISNTPTVLFETPVKICHNVEFNVTNLSTIQEGIIESYLWKVDQTVVGIDRNLTLNLDEGTYDITLIVNSASGCSSEYKKQISVLPNPGAELFTNEIICIGEEANLKAILSDNSGNENYSWSEGVNDLCSNCLEVTVSPDQSKFYYFEINHSNGCNFFDSIELIVAPLAKPIVTLSMDTTICLGTDAEIAILDHNSNYDYEWNQQEVLCNIDCTVSTVSPLDDTEYVIKVKNIYGCISFDSIQVAVEKSIPDFLQEEKFICEKDTTNLVSLGGQNPIWTTIFDTLCIGCEEISVSPLQNQFYYLNVTSTLGCLYKDSILVHIILLNSIDAGDGIEICSGEEIILGGIGEGNASWTPNTLDTEFSPTVSPTETTNYILTATKDECILKDSVLVEVIYKAEVFALGDTVCYGDEGTISAEGEAFTYTWYENGNQVFVNDIITIQPLESKELMVIGSRTTCENDTAFVDFIVHPKIEYSLKDNNISMFFNSRIKVEADLNENGNYSYEWTPSEGLECDDCPAPLVSSLNEKTEYSIIITDENTGCNIEDFLTIRVRQECNKEGFFVPNAFSPNGDGTNEYFSINVGERDEFIEIKILDRWGNSVFSSDNPNFIWDGTFNGSRLNTGVYLYLVTAYCPETKNVYHFGGDITIIK